MSLRFDEGTHHETIGGLELVVDEPEQVLPIKPFTHHGQNGHKRKSVLANRRSTRGLYELKNMGQKEGRAVLRRNRRHVGHPGARVVHIGDIVASEQILYVNNQGDKPPARAGTNTILDYFGFPDGAERTLLLMGYGEEDPKSGANVIRGAYGIARELGLQGNYLDTPPPARQLFLSLANSVYLNDVDATRLLLKSIGTRSLQLASANRQKAVKPEDNGKYITPLSRIENEIRLNLTSLNGWTKDAQHPRTPRMVEDFVYILDRKFAEAAGLGVLGNSNLLGLLSQYSSLRKMAFANFPGTKEYPLRLN